MTAPDATAIARELLSCLLEKGSEPGGLRPDDCGEHRALLTPIWNAWHEAEREQPGTGHIAAHAALNAIDRDDQYVHLLSSGFRPLGKPEYRFKARDYIAVLSRLGHSFALNACDDRIEVDDELLTDVQEATIRTELRDQGLRFMSWARDAYIAEAARNVYHPVKRYLESLEWDGKDHIAALAGHIKDRHGTFSVYLRSFLIGAVAKCYSQAQNPMLVLDGQQGIGKSYLAKWLASPLKDYYLESPIDPGNKDHHIRLMRTWIWEVGELGSTTRRADREALKYFLTIRNVTVRKPYGRYDIVKPALASFIGTVNNDAGFLDDPTGSRRFRTCTLEAIDWSYASLDVNQIWAQAYALYRAGKPWDLTNDEAAQASEINTEYEIEDPLHDLLQLHFEIDPAQSDWSLPTVRIREHLLQCAAWRLKDPTTEAMAIQSALKKPGLKKTRVKDPKTQKRVNGYIGIKRIWCE